MARGQQGHYSIRWNDKRNRYEARITIGHDPGTGKPRRQLITGPDEKTVRKRLVEAEKAVEEGQPTKLDQRTTREFLEQWLDTPGLRRESTTISYRDVVRLYVTPSIGGLKVVALTPTDIRRMLTNLESEGRSKNTRRIALAVIRSALSWGVEEGLLTGNVAKSVRGRYTSTNDEEEDLTRVESKKKRTLTVEQARQLLRAAEGEPLEAAWVIALTTGLRRGELLGLAWDDINLEEAELTVMRALQRIPKKGLKLSATKTEGSVRTIRLTPIAVDALRAHRKAQLAQRLLIGPDWPEKPLGVDLVFRSPMGTPVDPDNFRNRTYQLTLEALGERWSPHELRHTAASFLYAAGVDIRIISEVLGHSSTRVTSEVYVHNFAEASDVAADAMAGILGGGN